ncbi:DUF962-domain-containing protein [Lindgomyces ingoldianus]|uniref:DUF962-domain-containing protein n=1 Tax=Lindgomyces ingoldianus TaxID=673940 RepID=A0ACB6Q854_9PLEO|nr:DUF962-domain-containing protein [Lindgomyces ingoldianus]KAF2462758.1 DUF962-domain-containing protein [Lindgomyces ingoldianus]
MGFNLKQQLVAYGAYHRDPTNVKIHMTCVPWIMATAFFLGTNTPTLPLRTPSLLTKLHLPLNLSTLAGLTYSTLYLYLSPNIAGSTLAPLVLSISSFTNILHTKYQTSLKKLNTIASAIHVVAWILQFIGHGKFEGRKPALLDNLAQALFLAPLFVWYEGLFMLGFYRELRVEVEEGIDAEIRRVKEGKRK